LRIESRLHLKCPQLDVRSYASPWIALHPETHAIVAEGASLKEARHAGMRVGVKRPLLIMVPQSKGFFVGLGTPIEAPDR